MVILDWAHKLGRVLLDLFYPTFCVGCGQIGMLYCSTCRDSALRITPPICPLCGRPQRVSGLCERCCSQPPSVDGIRSVALFEGALRKAIHRFKYNHVRDMVMPLSEMLIAFWQENPLAADVVIPVPLHPRRLRERGYNQAALLAERLGSALQVAVMCDVLYRNRYTMSQTRLSAQERGRNVEGAFSCIGSSVQGKRVLLVDDVCTTGATLGACSVALKGGGARSVWALTIARAVNS